MKRFSIAVLTLPAACLALLGSHALLAVTPTVYYLRDANLVNENECTAQIDWIDPPPAQATGDSGVQEDMADVSAGNNDAHNVSSAGMQISSAPYQQANLSVGGISSQSFAWREGPQEGTQTSTAFAIQQPDGTSAYCRFSGVITSNNNTPPTGTPVTITGSIKVGWNHNGDGAMARGGDYIVMVDGVQIERLQVDSGAIFVNDQEVRPFNEDLDSFTLNFTSTVAKVGSVVTFEYQGFNTIMSPLNATDQSTFNMDATVSYP